jgi:hypothetical protein
MKKDSEVSASMMTNQSKFPQSRTVTFLKFSIFNKVLDGKFSQVISHPSKKIAIAYNATKQLLYKISLTSNKATVIFDDISYNAPENRQIAFSRDRKLLYCVTKRNEIAILYDFETDDAHLHAKLQNIPGDQILDFCEFGMETLLILSKDGYLSSYNIGKTPASMITVKKLYFNEGERPSCLVASDQHNKICVASLKPNDNMILSPKKPSKSRPPKQPGNSYTKDGAMVFTQYSCLSIHVFEYDFGDNFFAMKFEKPFKIPMALNEGKFEIDMSLSSENPVGVNGPNESNPLILFMVLKKQKSDCFSFILRDHELKSFTNLKLGGKVANHRFQVAGQGAGQLWVLGKAGNVRVFE